MFGEKGFLHDILAFLRHKSYHVRCRTIALLVDIMDASNKEHIMDSINKLLSTEKTIAVRNMAERFMAGEMK